VRRLKLSVITLLLLVALAWWLYAIQSQARSSPTWIEVDARPRTICYQGPPLRELANVQLWLGGPGVKLMQERELNLPRMD
jgi:hypothetical protein